MIKFEVGATGELTNDNMTSLSEMHKQYILKHTKKTNFIRNIKSLATPSSYYMGQFAQLGLNGFKRGQTHFSQLHISLNPDKLESCNFLCAV